MKRGCMLATCGFELSAPGRSDCDSDCQDAGCTLSLRGDGTCDAVCNVEKCGYDFGDCGYCAKGCFQRMLGNGVCDAACNNTKCNFDGYDCGYCAFQCFESMLGDGKCDNPCFNDACGNDDGDCDSLACSPGCFPYMIDDGKCQGACNNVECGYDGEDCFCAPGCTAELLSNSECDAVCAAWSCNYDNNACVLFIQDYCAPGCFISMVSDGKCDDACQNESCHYDGKDCSCAPTCPISYAANCEFGCLVPDCQINYCWGTPEQIMAFAWQLTTKNLYTPFDFDRDCASKQRSCSYFNALKAVKTRSCQPKCNQCVNSFGGCFLGTPADPNCKLAFGPNPGECIICSNNHLYTYCVDKCPRAQPSLPSFPWLCVPAVDTSSADKPGDMYVSNQASGSNDGTWSNSYWALASAFAQNYEKYTTIYLLKGTHELASADTKIPEGVLMTAPADILANSYTNAFLEVTTLMCTNPSTDHSQCASVPATIHLSDLRVTLTIASHITFRNVYFDGTSNLQPGCTLDACFYCPWIGQDVQGMNVDDRGNAATLGTYAEQTKCDANHNSALFRVQDSGVLTLSNVAIDNFRYQPKAIILNLGGQIFLSSVDFTNIVPSINGGAVILQETCAKPPYGCGSLTYDKGTVAYLNNGYEATETLQVGGFLYADGLSDIVLTSVAFQKNIAISPLTSSMPNGFIRLANFRSALFISCTFTTNIFTTLFAVFAPALSLVRSVDAANNVIDFAIEHVHLKNAVMSNNLASNSLIYATYGKDMQNMYIESCTFANNAALNGALINAMYTGIMTAGITNGLTEEVQLPDKSKVTGVFAPRHVYIENSSFTENLCVSVFDFYNLANVQIRNSVLFTRNGASQTLTYHDLIVKDFMADPHVYFSERVTLPLAPCQQIVRLQSCVGVAFTDVSFQANFCDVGIAGVVTEKASKAVTFTNVKFENNVGYAQMGTVLAITNSAVPVTLMDVIVAGNKNEDSSGTGSVAFGPGQTVALTNCQFTSNRVAFGGAIYAQDTAQLSISSSSFRRNEATTESGGVVAFVGSGTAQYALTLDKCTFDSNVSASASAGAVMITSDNLTRPYKVDIRGSTFISNSAATSGAALFIGPNLILTADSSVSSCTFSRNSSQKGTVAMSFSAGALAFTNCEFTANTAVMGSGITFSTLGAAVITLTSCVFMGNTGAQGVVAVTGTDTLKTLLSTKCTFQGNAGIGVAVQYGKWTDTQSSFSQNADSAVSLSNAAIALLDSVSFEQNRAKGSGGAAYLASGAVMTCAKCRFKKNSAKDKGGAIFVEQSSQVVISGSTFEGNTCVDKGSAMFLLGSSSPISNVSSSSFTGNSAGNSGAISLLSSSLSLQSVSMDSNTAQGATAGILLMLSSLTAANSAFASQTGRQGGFLYATTESQAVFSNCTFDSAYANSGGAVNVLSSNLTIEHSKITRISAVTGAGFVAYSQCFIMLDSVSMKYLTASDSAIGFISEGWLIVKNSEFAYYDTDGVKADKLTLASIVGSRFEHGVGKFGGGFSCTRCSNIFIQSSVFANNFATFGGGLYFATTADSQILNQYHIELSQFLNNTGWRGGAAYSQDVSVLYTNCSFEENSAQLATGTTVQMSGIWGVGGAVVPDCSDNVTCVFNFTYCDFKGNHADVSGGAIAWQDIRPNVTLCNFEENTALYGGNISSFAVSIQPFASMRQLATTGLTAVASGQQATSALVIALVDHYGNIVTTDNSSTAQMSPVNIAAATVSGVSKVTAVMGKFTFDKYIISAEPGTNTQISVTTNGIDPSKAKKAADGIAYVAVISFFSEMRQCVLGESHIGNTCYVCEAGKYSLDPNSTSCANCPAAAICYGNFTMVPREGYWRSRIDSDVFYECLYSYACTGSPTPPNNLSLTGNCAIGYMGNLCEACQYGYSRSSKYECALCPDQDMNIVRLLLITLGVAVLVGVMVYTTLNSAHKVKSLASIYIKILMNYLQIVILVASFNLSWPDLVLELFAVQETAGSFTEQAFSVDCFLTPANSTDSSAVVYNKLIVMAVIPVFLALAAVFAWELIYIYRRYERFPKDCMIATVIILVFLAHPTLTKFFFDIFTCYDVDGQPYLLQQLNVKCWDSKHVMYIAVCAVPAILLWILGVPALCLSYLAKNKKNLTNMAIRIRLGFLFNGYRAKAFYWEFVILYRKVLIICCSVFLTTISIPIQALCVMFILVIALYLQDKIKPFTTADLNAIELKSIVCAAVTIYCGLFFLTKDLGVDAKLVLFAAIAAANTFFMWHWSLKVFGIYIEIAVNKIPFLRRKFGNFRKVKDGLDDDLFVVTNHSGTFSPRTRNLSSARDQKAVVAIPTSMHDLYKLRLQYESGELEWDLDEENTINEIAVTSSDALFPPQNSINSRIDSPLKSQPDFEVQITEGE